MKPRKKWMYFHSHQGSLELLEPRNMLAGHALAAPISHLFHIHSVTHPVAAAVVQAQPAAAWAIAGNDASDCAHTELTATLTDATGGSATGTATFESSGRCGTTATAFTVSVTGATASNTFDVAIDGTVVGQLQTDDTGSGTLTLSSKDSTLPDNFPAVAANSVITISDSATGTTLLTGTLASETSKGKSGDSGDDYGDCGQAMRTNLSADLTDSAGSATGTVTFHSKTKHDSTTTSFTVSVTGAAVSDTLSVAIDGTPVGSILTDDTGAGSLTLSTKDSTLPSDFPTVAAGSVVTVTSSDGTTTILSGTLASTSSWSSSLRFAHRW
jgi:hypothetical protein